MSGAEQFVPAIVRAVTVRPGDKLIIRVPDNASADQRQQVRDRMLDVLPGVEDVIVIRGFDVQAVYRPDPPDEVDVTTHAEHGPITIPRCEGS